MISHKYRCIFVHVPKVAGQSIERAFLELHGLSWDDRSPLLLRSNHDPAQGPRRLAHLFASEYVECGHIDKFRFDSYFKFAFVRNPWDRLVSAYLFRQRYTGSFKQFVMEGARPMDPRLDLYRHLAPQVRYLYGPSGRREVDFIGRYEHLHRDFAQVCRKLGLTNVRLRRSNASRPRQNAVARWMKLWQFRPYRRKPYTAYYDAYLKDFVAERYAADIDRFGYEFGGNLSGPAPLEPSVGHGI